MKFDLIRGENNIITLTVGKKYLYEIVDKYAPSEEYKEVLHKEIDYFVNGIGNKNVIEKLSVPIQLYQFFLSRIKRQELAWKLRATLDSYGCFVKDEEFEYNNLFILMRRIHGYILKDRKKKQIHNFIKFEAKEPDKYFRLDDTLPDYGSIMCKFYYTNYVKYTNRTQSCAEGWTYQLCSLYLVIICELYKIVGHYVDDMETFLFRCFENINPIIDGLTITLDYDLGNIKALSVIYELMQLHESGKQLTIKKKQTEYNVTFSFHTKQGDFSDKLECEQETYYQKDSNGNRKVEMHVTGSGNILTLRIDIIGLISFENVTNYAVDKTFFDLVADKNTLEWIGYRVLNIMLTHTKEFSAVFKEAQVQAQNDYDNGRLRTIFNSGRECIPARRNSIIAKQVFKEIKPETLLLKLELLQTTFNLVKYDVDYYTVALNWANKSDTEISEILYKVDMQSAQQAKLRKMIQFVKSIPTPKSILNTLYRKVSYRL